MSEIAAQRLAFIGGYGHHLLRGALEDESIDVEALAVAPDRCDVEATRRKHKPLLDNGAAWHDDPVQMLESFKPTVVNIGGVYAHDAELTLEALRRDIAVVAEKPIAATWEELEALREAVGKPGRVLLTEFAFRSRPAFRAARQAVRDGRVGTPVLASAQKSYRFGKARPEFYKRRRDYGSTLLWVASHGLDAIYFTTEQAFTTAAGHHGNLAKPDYEQMEDHCAVIYAMDNGGTALVHGDVLRPAAAPTHGDDRLRIVGSHGQVEVRDDRCTLITHDQPAQDITDETPTESPVRELLAATEQRDAGGSDVYNTAASLTVAAALLAGRDACDHGTVESIR